MLNAVLCPCAPPQVGETPETVAAAVVDAHAHTEHAVHGGTMPADAGDLADCHTDSAVDECGMTDAADPEAPGKYADRSLDPIKPAPSYGFVAVAHQLSPASAHSAPWRQRPPAATPIHNRDRLLI